MLQGLQNLGNTCSINTLVQCIGHCNHLREWLLSNEPCKDSEGKIMISEELSRITREMWADDKSLAPYRFMKALFACLGAAFVHGEQQDMTELWTLLADKINTEVGKPQKSIRVHGESEDIEGFMAAWKSHNEKCMSPWLKDIQGWISIHIRCHGCGKAAKLYEPFCCLSIDLASGENQTMETMLHNMFQDEQVQKRGCDYCKQMEPATKQSNICMYPKVLVCSIKRFGMTESGEPIKRKEPIQVLEKMRFVQMEQTYHLRSIGNHVGSLHGGHYYAIAQNPDQNWYMYDDISIAKVPDITKVLENNRDGYMLFYELG